VRSGEAGTGDVAAPRAEIGLLRIHVIGGAPAFDTISTPYMPGAFGPGPVKSCVLSALPRTVVPSCPSVVNPPGALLRTCSATASAAPRTSPALTVPSALDAVNVNDGGEATPSTAV